MKRPKVNRTAIQKAEDIAFVANLRLKRYEFREILEMMNQRPDRLPVSLGTVFSDAKAAEKLWTQQAVDAVSQSKAEMLAELEVVRGEAWRIYAESKKPRTVKKAEKRKDASGSDGGQTTTIVQEERPGDINALRLVIEAQDRKAKLLGLDAPVKNELSGPGGTPIGLGTPKLTVIVNSPADERPWHEQVKDVTGRAVNPVTLPNG